jgi:hypothetical protein
MACPCLNDQDDLIAVIEVPTLVTSTAHPNPRIIANCLHAHMGCLQVSCPISSSFDFAAERALSALSAHTGARHAHSRCCSYSASLFCSACHMQHCSARFRSSRRSVVCNRHQNGEIGWLAAAARSISSTFNHLTIIDIMHGRHPGYWNPARRWG